MINVIKYNTLKTVKVALVSGGRESIAMVLTQGLEYYDAMLFADTGDDPLGVETNNYLIKYHNWQINTCYSKYGNIREYYANKEVDTGDGIIGHALPSQANKDCSEKFKIIPETKWLVEKFGLDVIYELHFGFSDSKKDKHRAERMKNLLSKKKKIKQIPKFPLIENQIDRDKAGKICQEYMGFIPERSQCLMCFERTIQDWKHMNKTMPNATKEIVQFEENSKLFKKFGYGLSAKPIRKILRLPDQHQQTLDVKPCPCVESFDMEICLTE